MTDLARRVVLYDELAYYHARAEKALVDHNVAAHMVWARKYHDLRFLMDGNKR